MTLRSILKPLLPLLAGMSMVLAVPGHAQIAVITSGDLCAPVNVGKALRTIQNFRGLTLNNSSEETIAVSCPLSQAYSASFLEVGVIIQNGQNVAQSSRCVLREKNPINQDVATYILEAEIPATEGEFFLFDPVPLADPFNRVNLTCTLPPNSGLGLLLTNSVFPE